MVTSIRNKGEWIAALCLAAFGAYITYAGSKLAYGGEVGPGPGFFPFWIGIGLLIFSSYEVVSAITPARPRNSQSGAGWRGSGRALSGWLGIVAALYLFRWVGFAISFVLLTVFYIVVLERRSLAHALAIAVALALAFYVLFVFALGVSLPAGPWGF